MNKNENRGFTLIEILIAVLIIGVLAAIALPQYFRAVEQARSLEGKSYLEQVARAEQFFFLQNGEYTTDFSELDIKVTKESYQ